MVVPFDSSSCSKVVIGDEKSMLGVCETDCTSQVFYPGQRVQTSFGPGMVYAYSEIDSIVYVTLSGPKTGLYLLRPDQVETAPAA